MKKTIAIISVLVTLFMLVACKTPIIPARSLRWVEGEVLEYTVTHADKKYYDVLEVAGALLNPENSTGVYTSKVTKVDVAKGNETTLETDLEIWSSYPKAKVGDISKIGIPSQRVRDDATNSKNIEFLTTVKTTVVFPLYKCTTVKIESQDVIIVVDDKDKYHVEYNDFVAECLTFTDKAVYSLKHNNKAYPDVENATINLNKAGDYTDNAALLFIARSLDMAALKSAGNVSIIATDIVYGATRQVTIATTSADSAALNNLAGGEEKVKDLLKVRISTGASIEGSYNYLYFDVNDKIDVNPDNVIDGVAYDICKNRILYMQQGHLLFTLKV